MGDGSKEAYYWLDRLGRFCIYGIYKESELPKTGQLIGSYYPHINEQNNIIGVWQWYNNKWNYISANYYNEIPTGKIYDHIIDDYENKIQLLVDIVLKKDIQYEDWIKKNIGDRYVQQG